MTEAQIKHMVDRFLMWKLPEDFSPDNGISFNPVGNAGTEHEFKRWASGTNLFDATQAEAMVRYMLDGVVGEHEDLADMLKLVLSPAPEESAVRIIAADLTQLLLRCARHLPEDDKYRVQALEYIARKKLVSPLR